jgi:ribosomal protein S18 acetylase RimI-like enzyme
VRLRDLTALYPLFDTEIYPRTAGRAGRVHDSWLSFWRWLRRSFDVVYIARRREDDISRIVGYIGLYDLTLGCSLTLAMAVFAPADRRQGYGRQIVEVLCRYLREKGFVRDVFAEVSRNNAASLAFLKAVEFEIFVESHRFLLLRRHP